jgi:hypothetical protein
MAFEKQQCIFPMSSLRAGGGSAVSGDGVTVNSKRAAPRTLRFIAL